MSPKRTASSSKPEDLRESDDLAPAKTETKAKKQKAGSTNDKGDSEDKKGRAIVPWTQDEELALRRGMINICLSNLGELAKEPGLQKRNTGKINMKLRGIAKAFEKQYGAQVEKGREIDQKGD